MHRSRLPYVFLISPLAILAHPDAGQLATPLDHNRILCPVLASLVKTGDLVPDEFGSVTLEQIETSLVEGTLLDPANANFQATGIADFDKDNKETQLHRNRCLPGTKCARQKKKDGGVTEETERWLNIYKMNGMEAVTHGFSTGVRGSDQCTRFFHVCKWYLSM